MAFRWRLFLDCLVGKVLAEAKTEFEQAIREKPDYAAAHCNLGLAPEKTGDNASAKVQFERAHPLDPSIAPISDH